MDDIATSSPAIVDTTTTSIDISDKVTTVISNANAVRLKYINDFISQLEKDYVKYGNKKRRLIKVRNILFIFDFLVGSILLLASILIQLLAIDNKYLSALLCVGGAICVSILPIITKVAEIIGNKNRNFEQLAVKKLNMCKQIFSRSIEDSKISHEELLEVFECKNQYENARIDLKINNKKEVDVLLSSGVTAAIKDDPNINKVSIREKIAALISDARKNNINGTYDSPAQSVSVTVPNSYIYPSLNIT